MQNFRMHGQGKLYYKNEIHYEGSFYGGNYSGKGL